MAKYVSYKWKLASTNGRCGGDIMIQPILFHRIIVMHLFQEELEGEYEKRFFDWLDEAASEYRASIQDYKIENIDVEANSIIIRVAGEDLHSGESIRAFIFSNLDGREVKLEPW
jgi:hypothetical protein